MSQVFCGLAQDTPKILQAKDRRASLQTTLSLRYAQPVVVLKLNIPGPIKDSPMLRQVLKEAAEIFESFFKEGILLSEWLWQSAGSEYYAVVSSDAESIKAKTVEIEENHPLGRLMDFDLILPDGSSLSREALGHPQRRCLICNELAFACGRSRAHGLEVLTAHIEQMVLAYQSQRRMD